MQVAISRRAVIVNELTFLPIGSSPAIQPSRRSIKGPSKPHRLWVHNPALQTPDCKGREGAWSMLSLQCYVVPESESWP